MLARNRAKGEAEFERLLKKYGNDPMIFYERGEAYDCLDELDRAESDYKVAEQGLKEPHWQRVASEALNDILYRKHVSAVPPSPHLLRVRIHALHALPQLPDEARADAISAVARLDTEPHLAASELRSSLELLVWQLLERAAPPCPDDAELFPMIGRLEREHIVPGEVIDRMHDVRKLGNKAIHRHSDADPVDFRAILEPFMEVARWYCSSQWAQG